MRPLLRLLSAMIAVFVLMDGDKPPLASADGCQGCSSNSPIINPFPIMWLRWGTSRILKNNSACPKKFDVEHARIAIKRIETNENNPDGKVRGYQLVVVDDKNIPQCEGTNLVGITFELSKGKEPVIVKQIAKTQVTQDSRNVLRLVHNEYRLVYYISPVISEPDESLCTHRFRAGWLRRFWWRIRSNYGPSFPPPKPSPDLKSLFEVLPDHLAEYAVIIPDAEYDNDGAPATKDDLSSIHLRPIPSWAQGGLGKPSLEWFEFACAAGALAHTDLNGMVDIGEDKDVRTAALRMVQAQYYAFESRTLYGIPISYTRNQPHPCLSTGHCRFELQSSQDNSLQDNAVATTSVQNDPTQGKLIEAMWSKDGAVCISHSRLWEKDTVISSALPYSHTTPDLQAGEMLFISEIQKKFKIQSCDIVNNAKSNSTKTNKSDASKAFFTSYVENHIHNK
ncbi:MAG TPA: ADYC domain-containing protein [Kofleriaceae bacterium]|nr:ADYC domain-containing protein [Kofleriaceae bacterium]